MSTKFYFLTDDEKKGPFASAELIAAGLQRDTLVWFKGCADWTPAEDLPELAEVLAELPPPRRRRRIEDRPESAGLLAELPLPRCKPRDQDAPVDLRPRYPESYLARPYRAGYSLMMFALGLVLFGSAVSLLALWDEWLAGNSILGRMQLIFILTAIGCGGVALLALIVGGIYFLVVLYRAWAIVQDGHATTTPGAAVGFLFIPLFQFYWIFVATLGLAKALNGFADRHRLAAPRASVLLGGTLAVYYVVAAIPFLGSGAAVLNLLIVPLFMQSIYRTARCFCTENATAVEDAETGPRPAATGVARLTGITAAFLGVVGLPCLSIGSVFTPIQWHSYQDYVRILEHNKARLARLENLPERERGEGTRQEIRMARSMVDSYGQFAVPRAWSHLVGFSVSLLVGVLFSAIAVLCACAARHSNSRLNST